MYFLLEHQSSFHNDGLFDDRNDREITVLLDGGHCVDQPTDRNSVDLKAGVCQQLVDEMVARTSDLRDPDSTGFEDLALHRGVLGEKPEHARFFRA